MKKQELSRMFNPYIAEIMAEGFYLCMTELKGGYGFVGQQTCFAKGRERVVLWIDSERTEDEERPYDNDIILRAARFTLEDGETTESHYNWPSQWSEHTVWEKTVYEIDMAMRKKHFERRRSDVSRWINDTVEFEMTDKLLAIVRRVGGFKTAPRKNIKVMKHVRKNRWVIKNVKSGFTATVHA